MTSQSAPERVDLTAVEIPGTPAEALALRPAVVEARGLRKAFKDNVAVDGIDLVVREGDTFGLLGPNGAGKSTTINLVLGLLASDGGSVTVFGEPAHRTSPATKRRVGYVPQDMAFFEELSGIDNVTYWGRLYGLRGAVLKQAVRDALDFTGLWDRRKDIAKTYSGGMQRRLNISCAIVHGPKLLIMDEPTVGVDPQSRNLILESVRGLAEGGCTVIYTSHYMEEIEHLCDYVSIVDHGKIIASGLREEVISDNTTSQPVVVEFRDQADAVTARRRLLEAGTAGDRMTLDGQHLTVQLDKGQDFAPLARTVFSLGLPVVGLTVRRPSLEEVFLSLTGKSLRD